jgi:3-hydroxybutyrate dehydrogenase
MKARNMTEEQVNGTCPRSPTTMEFVTVEQVASLAVYLCSDAARDHRREPFDRCG